jgi:predicted RNA-binding Zn-ribbon protein involved in translation (DUF1610 family)
MGNKQHPKTPVHHYVYVYLATFVLTLLFIWMLDFILSDINRIPGPDFTTSAEKFVNSTLVEKKKSLEKQQAETETLINNEKESQHILEADAGNSQETMNQLISVHRLNIENGVKPTKVEQQSMAESQARFLDKQKEFQSANERIATLTEQSNSQRSEIRSLDETLETQYQQARSEFATISQTHRMKIASIQLLFLVPFLLLVTWLTYRWKDNQFAPILRALLLAALVETGITIHTYFPSEIFKYIALVAAILVVLYWLVWLISIQTRPRLEWLLRQYREAYTMRKCPVCGYPIEQGPFRFVIWIKGRPIPLANRTETSVDESNKAYTCPACGTGVYEKCDSCGQIRHSLLPNCLHCGAGKPLAESGEVNSQSL